MRQSTYLQKAYEKFKLIFFNFRDVRILPFQIDRIIKIELAKSTSKCFQPETRSKPKRNAELGQANTAARRQRLSVIITFGFCSRICGDYLTFDLKYQ